MDERFRKLRGIGKEHSLVDREIDICLMKFTTSDKTVTDRFLKLQNETCLKITKHILYRTFLIFSLVLVLFILLLYNEDFRAEVLRLGHNYMYPVMRAVRLISLPMISTVQLSGYHDDMCLIDNPFYEHPVKSVVCSICQQTSSLHSLDSVDASTFEHSYLELMRCVHIKGLASYRVSFDQLKEKYHQHPQLVNNGINIIFSNNKEVSDHLQLMYNVTTEDILNNAGFHLKWISRRVGPSRFFSKVFPKPDFFPKDREMNLEKMILVDSYNAEPFTVPQGGSDHMLYIQASGRRLLEFKPPNKCDDVCQSHTIMLEGGDLVYMLRPVWDIESKPVEAEEQQQMSLAYIATF